MLRRLVHKSTRHAIEGICAHQPSTDVSGGGGGRRGGGGGRCLSRPAARRPSWRRPRGRARRSPPAPPPPAGGGALSEHALLSGRSSSRRQWQRRRQWYRLGAPLAGHRRRSLQPGSPGVSLPAQLRRQQARGRGRRLLPHLGAGGARLCAQRGWRHQQQLQGRLRGGGRGWVCSPPLSPGGRAPATTTATRGRGRPVRLLPRRLGAASPEQGHSRHSRAAGAPRGGGWACGVPQGPRWCVGWPPQASGRGGLRGPPGGVRAGSPPPLRGCPPRGPGPLPRHPRLGSQLG